MVESLNFVKRTYRTDAAYWRKYAESLIPKGQGPTEADTIARYGVRLLDGKQWIRHYIDKPNGSATTLCGLPCQFTPNGSGDVSKTCNQCAAELGRIRRR